MQLSFASLAVSGLLTAGVVLLLTASVHDIAARTVPNWIAAAIAVLGLALRGLDGTWMIALAAAFATFVVAAFCWRRGWMGGGDVKLLAATALLVPPAALLSFFLLVSWAGAILAVFYLIARRVVPLPRPRRPRRLIARALRAERWRIRRGAPLPYACAIAAGCLFVLL